MECTDAVNVVGEKVMVKNVRTACNLSEFLCDWRESMRALQGRESEAGIGVACEFDGCEREVLKCEVRPVNGTVDCFDHQNYGL